AMPNGRLLTLFWAVGVLGRDGAHKGDVAVSDANASNKSNTSNTTPVVKINLFDTDGRFAISTDDISERESELLKEQQKEAEVQKEEITQRNKAYMFLKQHKNDLNHAVCQAASDYFDFETLTQLVKMGGSVNKQVCGVDSGTPLHQMVFWGLHAGVTRLVRELGADPNLGDARGLPPLFAACAQLHELSNMETVRALVEGGADVNMEVEGWPLIELAAQRRQWQVTKCLLEAGASWPWSFASAEFKLGDKTYTMPLAQPSLEDSNYKFCKAAETNDAVQVISYLVAGKDIDFGLLSIQGPLLNPALRFPWVAKGVFRGYMFSGDRNFGVAEDVSCSPG
ncbi:unnamed protein product, partial [Effrenium voratum]